MPSHKVAVGIRAQRWQHGCVRCRRLRQAPGHGRLQQPLVTRDLLFQRRDALVEVAAALLVRRRQLLGAWTRAVRWSLLLQYTDVGHPPVDARLQLLRTLLFFRLCFLACSRPSGFLLLPFGLQPFPLGDVRHAAPQKKGSVLRGWTPIPAATKKKPSPYNWDFFRAGHQLLCGFHHCLDDHRHPVRTLFGRWRCAPRLRALPSPPRPARTGTPLPRCHHLTPYHHRPSLPEHFHFGLFANAPPTRHAPDRSVRY